MSYFSEDGHVMMRQIALVVSLCDTSDFEEGEIRPVFNPSASREWDKKIPKIRPLNYDIGINKEKEPFVYINNQWKSIKNEQENNI